MSNMQNGDAIEDNLNMESTSSTKVVLRCRNCQTYFNLFIGEYQLCNNCVVNCSDPYKEINPGEIFPLQPPCDLRMDITAPNLGINENNSINRKEDIRNLQHETHLFSLKPDDKDEIRLLTETVTNLQVEINELKENELKYQHEQGMMNKYMRINEEKIELLTMKVENLNVTLYVIFPKIRANLERKKCIVSTDGGLENPTGK